MIRLIPVLLLIAALWFAIYWWRRQGAALQLSKSKKLALGGGIGLLVLALLTRQLPLILGALTAVAVVVLRLANFISLWTLVGQLMGSKQQHTESPRQAAPPPLSREEACAILGLTAQANAAEIRAAHRRLIGKLHPDRGGSAYLAARINAAKELLLKSPPG